MYVLFPIALVGFLITWPILRRFTRIWVKRPISVFESIVVGIIAWLFLLSLVAWFGGIILVSISYFITYKILDLVIPLVSLMVSGLVSNSYIKSRYELRLDDTQDFFKEAIQFRRSEQRRFDILSLMDQERKQKKVDTGNDLESPQHERLQASLDKEKELDTQLALLREGTSIDVIELWHALTQIHSSYPMYDKVKEVRIDPNRKRFSLYANFPELNEEQLKDETTVLRFNRQVYDFLQSLNAEPWLKPYAPFFTSYFLICRATKILLDGAEVMYPFMKVGVLVSELRKLEGSYFNPRKLSKVTALAFNKGAQV